MIDIDPRLDERLRSFYDQIEASPVPARVMEPAPVAPTRGRRTINVLAGAAGLAVVAAGIAVFAVELAHHNATPPAAATRPSDLRPMPVFGGDAIPTSVHVVMPVLYGSGTTRLLTFTPEGTVYVQVDCLGKGPLTISSTGGVIDNVHAQCSSTSGVTTMTLDGPTGYDLTPLTLTVTSDRSTIWEVFLAQTGITGLPPLGGASLPADSHVLVPVTYRTGAATLPAFTPREHYIIESSCIGPGEFKLIGSGGSVISNESCGSWNGPNGTPRLYPLNEILGKPLTIRVAADPSSIWEILIVESASPTPSGLPSSYDGFTPPAGSTVLVAPTSSFGTSTLPTFDPTERYWIVSTCSGGGSMSITSQTAQGGFPVSSSCLQAGVIGVTGPADQAINTPISLAVGAPDSTTWEIMIYETNQPNGA